jgi:hypothetical protein
MWYNTCTLRQSNYTYSCALRSRTSGEAHRLPGRFILRSFAMIYFITDGEFVKIGFTDNEDVHKRIKELQIGNARKLELLGTLSGNIADESFLQRLLSDFNVSGEWFDFNLKNVIKRKKLTSYECSCGKMFQKSRSYNAHRKHCQVPTTEPARIYTNGSGK